MTLQVWSGRRRDAYFYNSQPHAPRPHPRPTPTPDRPAALRRTRPFASALDFLASLRRFCACARPNQPKLTTQSTAPRPPATQADATVGLGSGLSGVALSLLCWRTPQPSQALHSINRPAATRNPGGRDHSPRLFWYLRSHDAPLLRRGRRALPLRDGSAASCGRNLATRAQRRLGATPELDDVGGCADPERQHKTLEFTNPRWTVLRAHVTPHALPRPTFIFRGLVFRPQVVFGFGVDAEHIALD